MNFSSPRSRQTAPADDGGAEMVPVESAQRQIWDRLPRSEVVRDRRQKLFIDFVLSGSSAVVAIGAFR
jgi:hypothetical protein